MAKWNTQVYPDTGIYAVSSQFDMYFTLVVDYLENTKPAEPSAAPTSPQIATRSYHGNSPSNSFKSGPYWTGFYSSRPELKRAHYESARALMGADVFAVLGDALNVTFDPMEALDDQWESFAPSTHHDFVTGTSTDYVFYGEQLPLIHSVLYAAQNTRATFAANIATTIANPSNFSIVNSNLVVVLNQNGFATKGLANVSSTDAQVRLALMRQYPAVFQEASDGQLLALFDAPPLGYQVYSAASLAKLSHQATNSLSVDVSSDGNLVTLENAFLKAVVSRNTSWAIASLVDKQTSKSILKSGNVLSWRYDGGNIYRYGFEEGCGFSLYNAKAIPSAAEIVENGPIRMTVRTKLTVSATDPARVWSQNFTIEYTLVKDEPFLRINVTGAAFQHPSVMLASFKFNNDIVNYTHGTPYHWDWKQPFAFGLQKDFQLTMEATHDFVGVMDASGSYQGAVYHPASPSWGVLGDTLHGILLRNSPGGTPGCGGYGADGSDTDVHSVQYAIRVPSAFDPTMAKQEATAYQTPLQAQVVASPSPSLPTQSSFSLASIISNNSPAFITAIKRGSLSPSTTIVRIYNPTNSPVHTSPLLTHCSPCFPHSFMIGRYCHPSCARDEPEW